MTWYCTVLGGHTHVRVFENRAHNGTLIFANEEMAALMKQLAGKVLFIEEGSESPEPKVYRPGHVFQINGNHPDAGWRGALLLAEDILELGILGFIHLPKNRLERSAIYSRVQWKFLDFIGRAALPKEEAQP